MAGWVVLGKVSGLYGIKGWVKIFSYTEPRESIIDYNPIFLNIDNEWQEFQISDGELQGKGMAIRIQGIEDRDAAASLLNCDIAISREQLAELSPGEFYWADLEGLKVITVSGVELGTVSHLFTTGANDVVVVKGERERLIPFLRDDVIIDIDLEQNIMRVDWDPEF
jgi:16S rRNA processing protein RimM